MLVLPVTASCCNQEPPIDLDQPDRLAHLHAERPAIDEPDRPAAYAALSRGRMRSAFSRSIDEVGAAERGRDPLGVIEPGAIGIVGAVDDLRDRDELGERADG